MSSSSATTSRYRANLARIAASYEFALAGIVQRDVGFAFRIHVESTRSSGLSSNDPMVVLEISCFNGFVIA